jgi:hypothetical protein
MCIHTQQEFIHLHRNDVLEEVANELERRFNGPFGGTQLQVYNIYQRNEEMEYMTELELAAKAAGWTGWKSKHGYWNVESQSGKKTTSLPQLVCPIFRTQAKS